MQKRSGFTLTEILAVVAILAVLIILVIISYNGKRDSAADAVKKTDLERLKIAFEDYYGDHNCYPPSTMFDDEDDCGSNNLSPYLNTLPCDQKTGLPYSLQTDASGGCTWFTLTAQMNLSTIPTNCPGSNCGVQSIYVVSSGNVDPYPGTGGANPGGGSNPASTYYWCSGLNNCSSYNPSTTSCSPSYTDDVNCGGTPNSKCPTAGSCTAL